MSKDEIKSMITEYLLEHTGVDSIDEDEDIFESGLINSLFAIELMVFIEGDFGVKVGLEDLDMSNFQSISRITEFIVAKNGGMG